MATSAALATCSTVACQAPAGSRPSIASTMRVTSASVFLTRPFLRHRRRPKQTYAVVELGKHPACNPVATPLEQYLVNSCFRSEQRNAALAAHHICECLERLAKNDDIFVRCALGEPTGRQALQHRSNVVELLGFLDGDLRHDRSAMRYDGHQLFSLELPQRLAQRRSAHSQQLAHFPFNETIAWFETSGDNRRTQPRLDLTAQRRGGGRNVHVICHVAKLSDKTTICQSGSCNSSGLSGAFIGGGCPCRLDRNKKNGPVTAWSKQNRPSSDAWSSGHGLGNATGQERQPSACSCRCSSIPRLGRCWPAYVRSGQRHGRGAVAQLCTAE